MKGSEIFAFCCALVFLFTLALALLGPKKKTDSPPKALDFSETFWAELRNIIASSVKIHMEPFKKLDEVRFNKLIKLEKEFEIFNVRFHHVEKKLAGMSKTIIHEFTAPLAIELRNESLLRRAGVKK